MLRSLLERCSRRLLALLVAVFALYLFGDFYTTYLSLRAGAVEVNPISRFIIHEFGMVGFFVAKVVECCYIAAMSVFLNGAVGEANGAVGETSGAVGEESTAGGGSGVTATDGGRRVRPRLQVVLAEFPVAVALGYACFGVYLTVKNTLVYVSLTMV